MFDGLIQLAPYALSWICILAPFFIGYIVFYVRLMKAVKKIVDSFHWQTIYQKRISRSLEKMEEK